MSNLLFCLLGVVLGATGMLFSLLHTIARADVRHREDIHEVAELLFGRKS